jgi:hypothetical protein
MDPRACVWIRRESTRKPSEFRGTELRTVIFSNPNLFEIASQYLLDPEQWSRIAELNGLTDSMLAGVVSLTIPDPLRPKGGMIASDGT